MDVENDLDREVRSKIKNLEEGTSDFEIEYTRPLESANDAHDQGQPAQTVARTLRCT